MRGKAWQSVAKRGKAWQSVAKRGKAWQNVYHLDFFLPLVTFRDNDNLLFSHALFMT
jgi:hypothetical protein